MEVPNRLCIYETKTEQVEMIALTIYSISKVNTLIFQK